VYIYIFYYLAVGAVMGGLRLVCDFITFNFAVQTIDQIVICVAETLVMPDRTISVPVVFGVLMDFLEI
jgi:pyruvate dehydrogenase E1 component beta subunit